MSHLGKLMEEQQHPLPSGAWKRPSRSETQTLRNLAVSVRRRKVGGSLVRHLEARDQREETSKADTKRPNGGESFPLSSDVACAQNCLILILNSFESRIALYDTFPTIVSSVESLFNPTHNHV